MPKVSLQWPETWQISSENKMEILWGRDFFQVQDEISSNHSNAQGSDICNQGHQIVESQTRHSWKDPEK